MRIVNFKLSPNRSDALPAILLANLLDSGMHIPINTIIYWVAGWLLTAAFAPPCVVWTFAMVGDRGPWRSCLSGHPIDFAGGVVMDRTIAVFIVSAVILVLALGISTLVVFFAGNFVLSAFSVSFTLSWKQAFALVIGLWVLRSALGLTGPSS